MLKYIRIVNGPIEENSYLVWDEESREGALIDPGFCEPEDIAAKLEEERITLRYILNTHGHWDHICNDSRFQEQFNVPLLIHEDDRDYLTDGALNLAHKHGLDVEPIHSASYLSGGEKIQLGKSDLLVLHTPGHSPGSVIFYNQQVAFTGDTVFYGSVGRCDLPGGDPDKMAESLVKIPLAIPRQAKILPGHGTMESTLMEQLEINPFFTGKMTPK